MKILAFISGLGVNRCISKTNLKLFKNLFHIDLESKKIGWIDKFILS